MDSYSAGEVVEELVGSRMSEAEIQLNKLSSLDEVNGDGTGRDKVLLF